MNEEELQKQVENPKHNMKPQDCKLSGDGLAKAKKGQENYFIANTVYQDLFYLQVKMEDIDGNKVPMKIDSSKGENLHKIIYTPTKCGKYTLEVLWRGNHLSGSPFTVHVE